MEWIVRPSFANQRDPQHKVPESLAGGGRRFVETETSVSPAGLSPFPPKLKSPDGEMSDLPREGDGSSRETKGSPREMDGSSSEAGRSSRETDGSSCESDGSSREGNRPVRDPNRPVFGGSVPPFETNRPVFQVNRPLFGGKGPGEGANRPQRGLASQQSLELWHLICSRTKSGQWVVQRGPPHNSQEVHR